MLIFPDDSPKNEVTKMDARTRRARTTIWPAFLLLAPALAAAAYAGRASAAAGGETATAAQDVVRIESRLNQLEQRLYSIEASVRGLEQQSRISGVTAGRPAPDPEVGLLRSDVGALRLRLAEVECGLERVDERTLTAAARDARRRADAGAGDPCRLNPNAPVNLRGRP